MGICGTGMASLAGMLKSQGYEVYGSDQNAYPPMSTQLRAQGIEIKSPYHANNLDEKPDLVIIGNAISRGHIEAERVLAEEIPYTSMANAIHEFFLKDKKCLVVAGTHGKTGSSTLLAWVLETADLKPGFFIGGVPLNFENNYQVSKSEFFVLEGDEYDTAFFDKGPKFLHYNPHQVLLTSIEYDHADIYDSIDAIKESFRKLLKIIPQKGYIVANLDFPIVPQLIQENPSAQEQFYSLKDHSAYSACDLMASPDGMIFNISYQGETITPEPLVLNMFGLHNVSNALGVALIARNLNISWDRIAKAFRTFQGVKRRQEIIGKPKGITVIDDFAHHPSAVRETLASIRCRFKNNRIWAIFEPRSNTSKSDVFQKQYAESFRDADRIIISDVFMPEKVKSGKVLNVEKLVDDINRDLDESRARHISNVENIILSIKQEAAEGDIVLIMSNGAFGGIHQALLKELNS